MRRAILKSVLWFSLLALLPQCGFTQSETIDRIIATVNHRPVLLSEWEDGLRFEAFSQGRLPQTFTPEDCNAVLTRLIDRVLLLQQMQADYSPSTEEINARVVEIRKQLGVENSDLVWHQLLAQYGLTPMDLQSAVANQMLIMRFVDLRLRPTIRVDRQDIDQYYRDTLLPEMKKAGTEPQSEEQLTPRIRELLVQQRMDAVLDDWLANLRAQSEIHFTTETGEPSSKPAVQPGSSESLMQVPKPQ